MPEGVAIELGLAPDQHMEDGALVIEMPDGGVIIDLDPQPEKKPKSDKFNANLAEEINEYDLAMIANDLLMGIDADNQSRQEWLATHAEGIKLLGLVIEDNNSQQADNSAPLEGMSNARHPVLLEAVLNFQAVARGELLPASGPVKVRDDRPNKPAQPPVPPVPPGMGHNGGPALDGVPGGGPALPPGPLAAAGAGMPQPPAPAAPPPQPSMVPGVPMPHPGVPEDNRDELADALETDFNHYLTVTAKEYYPDTDRMLFTAGFGGMGVKKVYNCPLRRRPVSESVPMEDFIVSNALTDLGNAQRITHRIKMKPSTLKRMQLVGAYRDIELGQPSGNTDTNAVDEAKADAMGVEPRPTDPRDADYELYEVYCELNLDEYAPKKFKGKGLPLPYRVVIEKESQKVLEVRRNWRESDEECQPREYFVEYPYDKAFGFYGIGLLHILGNLTKALTAMMRITIDGGMFGNFPGYIFSKGAGRQLTNQFRVGPGQGVGLDVGLQKLSDAIQPLPYKNVDQAWTQYQGQVTELAQRIGGTANVSVGEGRQDAPVGTTLALIEQATKPIGAVLKRMHTAQSKELQLLADRFRDDPEAFWRFNRRPAMKWRKEQLLKALEDYDLVPVSDPNNPTKLHRAARTAALQQFSDAHPGLLDPRKVWKRVAHAIDEPEPDELLAPPMPPQQPPVDPGKMAMAQAKMQGDQLRAQTEIGKAQLNARMAAEDRASKIRQLEMQIELEELRGQERRELEELKAATRMATEAERAHQQDRHKALDLVSQREEREQARRDREAERSHKADIAKQTNESRERIAKSKPKPKAK